MRHLSFFILFFSLRAFALETPLPADAGQGTLIEPAAVSSGVGLVVIGGSEGGMAFSTAFARRLSEEGFVAAGVAWWLAPGLPNSMTEVEVTYFEKVVHWLRARRPDIRKWVIVGSSRGGELALVAGTYLSVFDGVVAISPSGVINPSFREDGTQTSSWKVRGRLTPFWLMPTFEPDVRTIPDGRVVAFFAPAYERNLVDPKKYEPAIIPLERARSPILILSGADDAIWPSCRLSALAFGRRTPSSKDKMLCIPNAGHDLGFPGRSTEDRYVYHPVMKMWLAFGGSAEGARAAQDVVRNEVLSFLRAL